MDVGRGSEVVVQPWFSPEYYAYYWVGLREVFGDRVIIADSGFPDLREPGYYEPHGTFAFQVGPSRYFISAKDRTDVNRVALRWTDIYGAVNLRRSDVAAEPKLWAAGPSFGVRAWSSRGLMGLVRSFGQSASPTNWRARQLVATARRQLRSPTLGSYRSFEHSLPSGGIFYLGSLWQQHPGDVVDRMMFVETALEVAPVRFRGGLVPTGSDTRNVPEAVLAERISQDEYLAEVRRAAVVFNHPAVHGCLGWKLGEFLALGKAIITTPVSNALPAPLVHEEHWHVVERDRDAMAEAIHRLLADVDYRHHLESGARAYFDQYLAPGQAIRALLHRDPRTAGM